jgi:hypothetical protein
MSLIFSPSLAGVLSDSDEDFGEEHEYIAIRLAIQIVKVRWCIGIGNRLNKAKYGKFKIVLQ